jgi:hypothetical protein
LVPIWGLRGAAVALALSSLTQLIGSGLILIYAVRADGGEQSTPLVDELAGCA